MWLIKRSQVLTILVVPQCLLKVGQVPALMRACDGTHAFYFAELCVLQRELHR